MTKLNQIIAIEKGVKSRVHSNISEFYKLIQKPALFEGVIRTYLPKDDDGEKLPPEKKLVNYRAKDVLSALRMNHVELFDITAQKDLANMKASAPVVIDGITILPPLPVTTLLFLEKQVTDLHTFAKGLPVLDVGEAWTFDENQGLSKTEPVQTHRTKKISKPIVMYPATPEHPAQTQMATEDVIAGFWETVKMSGAMSRPDKDKIVARLEKLLIAVKEAREEANGISADAKPAIGAPIYDYLLG